MIIVTESAPKLKGFIATTQAGLKTQNSRPANFTLDTHPLLREYFGVKLRATEDDAWRDGHCRLYAYLCATTPDKPDATLEDLQPLYQAGRSEPALPDYPWESQDKDLAEARRLIETCGYGRRMEELEDAEAALKRA
ncbi:MAG: hypothetical protein ABI614_05265 [Planctomycetota bacterium]